MQVWNFSPIPHENVDSFISRFEELRFRAAREGHYLMATEGWAMILLRQLPLSQQQITHILEPYEYQMPTTEQGFTALLNRIRRLGHASENRPGTVARLLGHPAPSMDGRGHFHAITDHDDGTLTAPPAFMIGATRGT